MIDWRVGDKVVCVDVSPTPEGWVPSRYLAEGEVYELAAVGYPRDLVVRPPDPGLEWSDEVCVALVGVSAPEGKGPGGLVFFLAHRFRKTIDKPAATELFERLCREATRKEPTPCS